jgi:eukaryotic-like serine/threonine-protein kinase
MTDNQLEAIFDAALQKETEIERAAFLEGACGPNHALRDRVETLLRAHAAAGRFLSPEIVGDEETPGSVIGRYKLLQRIGEGGFGVVYMAEQLEPVRRKVALKIIKLGMDTRQVVARFESERQALALMDHPHIARVFDAGATDSGRPYFVMELVRGVAITEYCDRNSLSLRERLELFVSVCLAVQHAHQKGIIHRDLKPSNILVTLHDGKPVPKVIDFGVAKATCQRLTDKTVFTEFRQAIGTPQYMSPEQAEMSGLDVDTRCDIYSLGVLLYELMTSTTPLDADWLKSAGYAELQRIIREEEPPPPSQRVSTLHEQLVTIARQRRSEPTGLPRLFRGDLDWIVMKALEKDRTRRYATAGEFAADIERHLHHEPVIASPPGVIYRMRKFARRNRTGVTAGLIVAFTVLIGLAAATAGFVRANREAARSRTIASFLEEIVVAVNPTEAGNRHVNVEDVINRARALFGDDHATVAAALDSLAMQVQRAGNLQGAEELFEESARIWRKVCGETCPSLGVTLGHVGSLHRLQGDDARAESALREALSIAARLPESLQLSFCESRSELATILQRTGRTDEAIELLNEVLRIRRLERGGQEHQIGATLEQLTGLLVMANRIDEADQAFAEGIEVYRPLLPRDGASIAYYHFAYGHWLRQHGRLEKAEPLLREAVRIYRQMPNPPRDLFLGALDGLFQLIRRRDDALEETIAVFHECMHNMAHVIGNDHPQIGAHLFGFARVLGDSNRSAEAIPLLIDGMRIHRKAHGERWEAGSTLDVIAGHVRRIVLVGDLPSARYQVAMDGAAALVADDPSRVAWRHLRGMCHFRLEHWHEALADLSPAEGADASGENEIQRRAFVCLARFRAGEIDAARRSAVELEQETAVGAVRTTGDTKRLLDEVHEVSSDGDL